MLIWYRRRLLSNPAGSHELFSLELSWAWEPMNSSGASTFSSCTRSRCCVLNWDMARWWSSRTFEMSITFWNKFVANSRNKGGGLCLFWKKEINLRVSSFSPSHIDAIINENQNNVWRLTGFYGASETRNREELWDLLRRLNSQFKIPWCCLGDFNELVRIEEKQGKHLRFECQMQLFQDVLDDCGFVDLGFIGPQFTWTNNRTGDMTWERLDRAVATPEWLTWFPLARVHHLDWRWSDHKPIWVGMEPMLIPSRKLFRFEEVWTTDISCEKTIEATWRKSKPGVPMYTAWEKIHACRRDLRKWSRNNFGNIQNQISETKKQLKTAEALSM